MPVHIGLGSSSRVDIEITSMSKTRRVITRQAGVTPGRGVLTIRVPGGRF